jgi:hypothetical protein
MAFCGGNKSSLVYIFDLREITQKQIKVHTINMDFPINHFVIGYKDQVCINNEKQMIFPGEFKRYLVKHHTETRKKAQAQLEQLLPPPPPPIEIEQSVSSCCGFFPKKKELNNTPEKGRDLALKF